MRQLFTLLFLSAITNFYGQDGDLDTTFGNNGFVITEGDIQSGTNIVVLPDDKIIMVGGVSQFNVVRYMPNGTIDTAFGTDGIASVDFGNYNDFPYDVALQPDGKIVVIGVVDGDPSVNDQAVGVTRLNPDGTIDLTFNGTGKLIFDFDSTINHPNSVALQADGKIVVAGYTGLNSSAEDFAVARINPDGTFDTSFDGDGKKIINVQNDDHGQSVAIQSDGKIVLGGSSYPFGSSFCWFAAVRLTTDGQLDETFSGDGKALAKIGGGNDSVYDMAIQPDGKILLAADSYLSAQHIGVVRFTTSGELDTTFSGDGKFNSTFVGNTDYVNAITLQPDGKILVAGSLNNPSEKYIGLIRITEAGELDTTFSTDGKAVYDIPSGNGGWVYDMKVQSTGQILISGYISSNFMLARVLSGNELGVGDWNKGAISFYPNPAKGMIYFNENVNSVSIYSIDGKKTLETAVFGQADISRLSKGIYIVHLATADGKTSQQKLVVE